MFLSVQYLQLTSIFVAQSPKLVQATSLLKFLYHTQLCTRPIRLLCRGDQCVAENVTYTTHNNKKKERSPMPSVGLEPAIPAIKQLQT